MLPSYDLAANLPPLVLPTLSVNIEGRVNLPYSLVEKLKLRKEQPIDLVPPRSDSAYWHLNLRPEADARVRWYTTSAPAFAPATRYPSWSTAAGSCSTYACCLANRLRPTITRFYPRSISRMPSLPSSKRRPWQPAPTKREYVPYAARSPEYGTARWQAARAAQLARAPLCARCAKQGLTTAATVCDHRTPVRLGGDFWDTRNYQSLCCPCHQAKSASERTQQPQAGQ